MGLFKMAVYGGIGYLIYQMLFSDMPTSRGKASRGEMGGGEAQPNPTRGSGRSATGQFTGRYGQGMDAETHDQTGTTVKHKVGRGVV